MLLVGSVPKCGVDGDGVAVAVGRNGEDVAEPLATPRAVGRW